MRFSAVLLACVLGACSAPVHTLPTVAGISPDHGLTAGGTRITVTGSGFTHATAVLFGLTASPSFTVIDDTQLSAVAPPGEGVAPVRALNEYGGVSHSPPYIYGTPPEILSLSPPHGPSGTAVELTGPGVGGATSVLFGSVPAKFLPPMGDTVLFAFAPPGTGMVNITALNEFGSSNAIGYTYEADLPTLSAITPAVGSTLGGTQVTLTGTNLDGFTGASFGGAPATDVLRASPTQLTAMTPPGTGSVQVTLTTHTGTSNALIFSYVTPQIESVSPGSGPTHGGTGITVTGTALTGTTAVTVGGIAATNVVVVSDSTVTATTPAYVSGKLGVDVVATTPSGAVTLTGGFTYVATAATLTSVTPSTGPVSGGTTITLGGTGFVPGTTVTIGGSAASNVNVVNATSLTATTPASVSGSLAADVSVNNGVSSATLPGAFTYQ